MANGAGLRRRRVGLIFAGLLAFGALGQVREPALAIGLGDAPIDATLPPIERAKALVALAANLVEQAGSGQTQASAFRIDVAYYRETLRDLVKDNDQVAEGERLSQPLLMDMVRMTALLQSAAQCQTGRYIVCPPDLMTQLRRQQGLLEQSPVSPGGAE
jgi:hypothetical protein